MALFMAPLPSMVPRLLALKAVASSLNTMMLNSGLEVDQTCLALPSYFSSCLCILLLVPANWALRTSRIRGDFSMAPPAFGFAPEQPEPARALARVVRWQQYEARRAGCIS